MKSISDKQDAKRLKSFNTKGNTIYGKASDHATKISMSKQIETTDKNGRKYSKTVRYGHLFDYNFVRRLNQRQKRKRIRQAA